MNKLMNKGYLLIFSEIHESFEHSLKQKQNYKDKRVFVFCDKYFICGTEFKIMNSTKVKHF